MLLTHFIYLSVLVAAASSACFDNGDKEIGGSCYKLVNQRLSFEDARYWCHYKNPVTASFLTYIPNAQTANFLAAYARAAFASDNGNFWIGLWRDSSSSPWQWDNGASLGWSNFGIHGENYAAESIINTKWNTQGQDTLLPFVCSYDPAAPPTFEPPVTAGPTTAAPTTITAEIPTTTAASSACFDNGDKEIGGSCYKFVNQRLSFEDARYWCHYKNPVTASFLTYIPNAQTANFLASYARSAFASDHGNFWIGLWRDSYSSPWKWDNSAPVGWTNFGILGENYAAESIINTKWNTQGKDTLLPFVCSYDPAAPPTFTPPATDSTTAPFFTTSPADLSTTSYVTDSTISDYSASMDTTISTDTTTDTSTTYGYETSTTSGSDYRD